MDRRINTRINPDCPVRVRDTEGGWIDCWATDLSSNGVAVSASHWHPVGPSTELEMTLALESGAALFRAGVEVIYTDRRGVEMPLRVGLRFVALSEEAASQLTRFIRACGG